MSTAATFEIQIEDGNRPVNSAKSATVRWTSEDERYPQIVNHNGDYLKFFVDPPFFGNDTWICIVTESSSIKTTYTFHKVAINKFITHALEKK